MKIKKFLILSFIIIFFQNVSLANVLPAETSDIPLNSIGVYQVDNHVVIHSLPDKKSEVIFDRDIVYSDYIGICKDDFFAVLIPKSELGYMFVTDISDDENWVKVIYNKKLHLEGWVPKKDDFQFMTWMDFFNLYGKKYGLYLLSELSPEIKGVLSQPDESGQVLGKISKPKFIRLTSIEGLWALVSVLDFSNETTTGYIKWRSVSGKLYFFPKIH